MFVDLGAGTARGLDEGDAANVGTDTFTGGVKSVVRSLATRLLGVMVLVRVSVAWAAMTSSTAVLATVTVRIA